MKKNRIIALLLVLTMVVSICPSIAFAASGTYQLAVANAVTVDGTDAQTVDVYFQSVEAQSTYSLEADWSKNETDGTSYLTLTSLTAPTGASPTENSADTGRVYWTDTSFSAPVVTEAGGTVWTATYTVAADTPTGTYTVSLTGKATDSTYNTTSFGTLTATIEVTNNSGSADPSDGYTANIVADATNNATVRVGDTIMVDIGSNLDYAAAEMTITYDSSLVSFVADANAAYTVDDDGNGTLKLADYGDNKTASGSNYVLSFTANAAGDAVFKITKAGFGTGTSAETADLTAATVSADGITIAISAPLVNVTFTDDNFHSEQNTVEVGGTFTFYPEQSTGAYYDYTLPTATVNGEAVTVTATDDGGWKVENVTGALTIDAAARTPKSYGDVAYEGTGAGDVTNQTTTATYLTDIVFTIPADKAATTENGYEYTVTATIAGTAYDLADPTTDDAGNRTYTIPGAAVKGAVTVKVTKTELYPNKVTVSIGGNAAGDGNYDGAEAGASIQVDKNGSAELTVDTESGLNKGYNYEVKNGEETLTLDENGKVTIENISEDTTITINKTLNVEGVKNTVDINGEQKGFVTLNGNNMWLIQLPNHVENTETAVYKYNGQEMYWSADHGNYVIVVISETAPEIDAGKFTLETITATPTIASNNWDVNKSGEVDANDAQLIWNMYSNVYQNFTDNVTAEKFMLADANHDGILDTNDAVVIISKILGA